MALYLLQSKKIFFLSLILLLNSCNGQVKEKKEIKESDIMIEKLDIKQLKEEGIKTAITDKDFSYELIKTYKDGSYIEITGSVYENGFVKRETPPKPSFKTIYKEYYSNGNLKKKEVFVGENVKIEKSMYYNVDGSLAEEVNEDKKFGKIKYDFILKFLDEKKLINLENGNNRYDEDRRATFVINYDEVKNIWHITIVKGKPNNEAPSNNIGEPVSYFPIVYTIDGETGKKINEEIMN